MSTLQTPVTETLAAYIRSVSLREPDVLRRLREATAALPNAGMQISPEQGQFMALLVQLTGATRTLEVGVFTGYSSTAVALALPANGRVVACDISEEYTDMARRYWREAGVADKVELLLGAATASLETLLAGGGEGTFDFAFIDADKGNYQRYYEAALRLVRPGGLVAIDNVLWHGKVIEEGARDEDTRTIRAFNQRLHADERVSISLVPIGDGLMLARRRA